MVNQPNDNAGSHGVFVGVPRSGLLGRSSRTSADGPYLSLKLDDTGYTAPIFAGLFRR